ncbi:hypothetical protein FUA26_00470 [Seonamhaeicola algicola]|uniref:Uncharacterized protein n=1 Tax=Seonamhaeicola algicola TaxID=1719036 RepID=A0A5C7B908_9FLAO|nr:hypothetical protein [Seonamhaeicola algicola]TXE15015.1 hypothetical protein FUA26_00470 [Seonamhaeicola algicola]
MKTSDLKLNDRSGFKINLLSNLNYYGNLDTKAFGYPVKKIVSSTEYEELKCISYHPKNRALRATVHIKNQSGYLGSHCNSGSYEYVRFYIDYENNGNWEDLGVSSFRIHDIEDHKGLCYGVKLIINPKIRKRCSEEPVLPNVRAILSWNVEPPVNTPSYKPVWGNVKEARIQIAPKPQFQIPPIFDNPIDVSDFINPVIGSMPELSFPNPMVKISELKKKYKNDVDEARLVTMALKNVNTNFSLKDIIKSKKQFEIAKIDISKVLDILKSPKFNTTYEELKCISLNRKLNEIHADIHLKKSSGYSGNLCSSGSKEYVAFYMDFGSGWEFMGTSSVTVFDINQIPKEGLWYNAYMPVDLTPHQKKYCKEGKAKIKGILSWNTPPTPNAPNFVATWGDWEVCDVEIKPLPKGFLGLKNQPWIESLGGVDTEIINTISGLAKGPSLMANSIVADYSPFDGNVYVTGKILNQIPVTKYKIMIKEPGGVFLPFNKKFNVNVTTFNTILGTNSSVNIEQTPTGDFYDYIPKSTGNIQKFVNDDILLKFKPTDFGIHELYIESNTGEQSETVRFMVDKDAPKVAIEITSGMGNCGKFSIGDVVEGTFEVKNDTHLDYLKLSLAPFNPAGTIQTTNITSSDITVSSGSLTISLDDKDSSLDYVTGTWKIDTANLPACGYTVHIRAEDRTIVNSTTVGKHSGSVSVGFCLEAA